MNLAVWGGGLICIVVSWCCGATLEGCFMLSLGYGWSLFLSSRRLTSVEGLLAAPLGGPPSTPFASSGSKRIDAIKRAIIHLKIRGEVTECADRQRTQSEPSRDSYESEEELCRMGQRWVSSLSGAADGVVVIVDEQQGLVMYGPLGDSPRYRAVIERLYGGYLRSGFGTPTSSHDDASGGSIFGGFSELGFCYALIHPLGWESHGVTRRGMVWVGFPPERPPAERTVKEFHRSVTRLEEELRVLGAVAEVSARAREAESSNARKSEFLTHISHDLRSPIHNIKAVLSYLRPIDGDVGAGEMIDIAARNCDALTELVEDLLDFTRLGEGRLCARPERFEIALLVGEVVASFAIEASRRRIDLRCNRPLEALEVDLDRRQLRRVIMNIVGNAVKFTDSGSVEVRTAIVGDSVEIVVRDTGIGMDESQLAQLFTPFARFEERRFEGVGLGLSLTKVLVELNGGTIAVTSSRHVGSEFRVSFPLATRDAVATALDSGEGGVVLSDDTAVLIIDDDRDSCESFARVLSGYRVRPFLACSLEDAVRLIAAESPPIIVSDLRMPDGGCVELVPHLSHCDPHPKLFLLTGCEPEVAHEVRGVSGVFQKPLDIEEFARRLNLRKRCDEDVFLPPPQACHRATDQRSNFDYSSCSISGAS